MIQDLVYRKFGMQELIPPNNLLGATVWTFIQIGTDH